MGMKEFLGGMITGRAIWTDNSAVQAKGGIGSSQSDQELRTLTIVRSSQLVNVGAGYDVLVDGVKVGKIRNGGTLTTQIPAEAEIHIRCASLKSQAVALQIRAGDAPRIEFTTVYGGGIRASVTGAEVISSRTGRKAAKKA